jgi:hypothetical protein
MLRRDLVHAAWVARVAVKPGPFSMLWKVGRRKSRDETETKS